jgi:hypothetical protein
LFADAVLRLLDDAAERERFGRAGPSHVAKNWNWELSVQNVLWQFDKAIESYRRRTN